MYNSKLFRLALALGFAAAVGIPSAGMAAGDKSSADVSKFKEKIQKDAKISQQDLSTIEPQLQEFSQRNADPDKVSDLAKTAMQNNCTGPCLSDVLTSMNSAMSKGLSDGDAHDMVSQALRDQVQARGGAISDPSELGSQVRASVDAQLSGKQKQDTRSPETGTMGGGAATGGTPGGGSGPGYGR